MRIFKKAVKLVILGGAALVIAFLVGAGLIKKAVGNSNVPNDTKAPWAIETTSNV